MVHKKACEVDDFLALSSQTYPIVLIYGSDKGLVSERANVYSRNSGVRTDDPFSTSRLDAEDVDHDPARLYDEAYTMPLRSSNRLVWIRNASTQKGLTEAVKWLLQKPPEKTFILIEAGNLKKEVTLRKLIEQAENAVALPCYSNDKRSISHLIDEVLSMFDMRITRDARTVLINSLVSDRLASRSELEKLCLYTKGKSTIHVEDVADTISNVNVTSYESIIDAIISGNLSKLNNHLNVRLEKNITLFSILNALQRQFQQLQELRYIMDTEHKNPSTIVSTCKPKILFHRYPVVKQALLYWETHRLAHVMEKLQNAALESREHTVPSAIIIRCFVALTTEAAQYRKTAIRKD